MLYMTGNEMRRKKVPSVKRNLRGPSLGREPKSKVETQGTWLVYPNRLCGRVS